MKPHAKAWIDKHGGTPEMEAFLVKMQMEGFDLHHLDGLHTNNDPENIVLIYSGDHERIHASKIPITRRRIPDSCLTLGEQAYRDRDAGEEWKTIKERLGNGCHSLARRWAARRNMPWPIVLTVVAKTKIKVVREDRAKARKTKRESKQPEDGSKRFSSQFATWDQVLREREPGDLSPAYLARKLGMTIRRDGNWHLRRR